MLDKAEVKLRKEIIEKSLIEFKNLDHEKRMFALLALDLSIETLEFVKSVLDGIISEKKSIAKEFVKIVSN